MYNTYFESYITNEVKLFSTKKNITKRIARVRS